MGAATEARGDQVMPDDADRLRELAKLQRLAAAASNKDVANSASGNWGKVVPDYSYAERVRRRVRPNIVIDKDMEGNPTAVVEVWLAPDGALLRSRLTKSSGNPAWDTIVLRAVERSDPFPRAENGKAPAVFTITFRPKD
ncbi:hypothetical protein CS8_093960 [Cupriavidus sp. 8B]